MASLYYSNAEKPLLLMQNSSHNGLCIGESIEMEGRPEHRQRAAIRVVYASESITLGAFGLRSIYIDGGIILLEGATVPLFTMVAM